MLKYLLRERGTISRPKFRARRGILYSAQTSRLQAYQEAVLCLLPFRRRSVGTELFCCLRLLAKRSLFSTADVTDLRSCSHLQLHDMSVNYVGRVEEVWPAAHCIHVCLCCVLVRHLFTAKTKHDDAERSSRSTLPWCLSQHCWALLAFSVTLPPLMMSAVPAFACRGKLKSSGSLRLRIRHRLQSYRRFRGCPW